MASAKISIIDGWLEHGDWDIQNSNLQKIDGLWLKTLPLESITEVKKREQTKSGIFSTEIYFDVCLSNNSSFVAKSNEKSFKILYESQFNRNKQPTVVSRKFNTPAAIVLCVIGVFLLTKLFRSSESSNENTSISPTLSSVTQKIDATLKPNTSGLKKESSKKYSSRFNALVKGVNSQDIQRIQNISKLSCDSVDWKDYGREKRITVESIYDSIRLKRSCYAGTSLAFIVDNELTNYRDDASTQLYNMLQEIGLTENEIIILLTGESDEITFHFATITDTYNHTLRNKYKLIENYNSQ